MGARVPMTLEEARAWLAELCPEPGRLEIESVEGMRVVCTAGFGYLEARPGGSISGPSLFWAADLTGYAAVNVLAGPAAAIALAQSGISFLAPADPGPLRVEAEVLTLASRSAVVEARVYDRHATLAALCTMHFALPSRAGRAADAASAAAAVNGHREVEAGADAAGR
jgi:acyl-coenzyme A thioesterase PaaI-like protein